MKDIYHQFREQAEHITITPGTGTWSRIEARLHTHRSQRKLFTARLFSIAAIIMLLIVIGFSTFLYSKNQYLVNSKAYTMSIEQLRPTISGDESIFDVEKIRRSYADLRVTRQ